MTSETFDQCLDFINRNNFVLAFLSGGEPTEHPQFLDFLNRAVKNCTAVMVASNGMNLPDHPEYLEPEALWQVINDPRYYPQRITKVDHPRVFYADELPAPLTPLGRSKGITNGRMSPLCFNLRSVTRSFGDFQRAVLYLRSIGKMCTPSILVDGHIVAGESRFCHVIGHVTDDNHRLTENVALMTCSECGLVSNLNPMQREAVGEL